MKNKILIMVPARLESQRFSNKLLAEFNGKSIIANVLEQARTAANVIHSLTDFEPKIILATDTYNDEFKRLTKQFKVEYFFMDNKVSCGSERIRYVYLKYPKYDYYVSMPADEPGIEGKEVADAILKAIDLNKDAITTAYSPFYCKEDLIDTKSCKVVIDQHHNVLYMSRAVVPASKSGNIHNLEVYKKHYGLFIFPRKVLKRHRLSLWYDTQLNPTHIASLESLEQNMFIRRDVDFKAIKINHIGFGIDSPEQIKKLEERLFSKK